MKTSRVFTLYRIRQYSYISRYADIPYFSTRFSVRGTFQRMHSNELPVWLCVRLTVWWFFRALIVHRRELSF